MIYLENEFLRVGFSALGAEIQQIENLKNGADYLWKGDAKFWGKFSPILFPIVGGLKENTYNYNGKFYHLNRHGFAREKTFELELQTKTELLFVLTDSSETLAIYPFQFRLAVRYQLTDNRLSCSYEVYNPAEKELIFSIGGHPAFAIDTAEGMDYSDYYLQFNKDTEIEYHEIEHDLISNNTQKLMLDNGILKLSHELFYNDALVFKTLKSDRIVLANSKNSKQIAFEFPEFPYFGIWAAKDADFVCLEPWCGIADLVEHNQNLKDKEGVIKLPSKEAFKRTWTVVVS